jgi:hypothetical protein
MSRLTKDGKRFLLRGLFFALVVAALLWIANAAYLAIVTPKTVFEITEQQFAQQVPDINMLFLGDSHVKDGLDPRVIAESFNFASPGENYLQTYWKLRHLLERDDLDIEAVVLPLDLHSFSSTRTDQEAYYWYWSRYDESGEIWRSIPGASPLALRITALLPVLGNGLEFVRVNWRRSELIQGFQVLGGNFSRLPDKLEVAKSQAAEHLGGATIQEPLLLESFTRLLELAAENDVALVFVRFPVSPQYNAAASAYIGDVDAFYAPLLELIESAPNATFIDAHALYFDRLEYFSNSEHLNGTGAEAFTRYLAERFPMGSGGEAQ